MPSLRLNGISKSIGGTRVLADVSFTFPDDSLITLVGPAGSGKSTLLRIMAGLEPADDGTISTSCAETDAKPARHGRIALVPSVPELNPRRAVRRLLAEPLRRAEFSRLEMLPLLGALIAGEKHWSIERRVQKIADTMGFSSLLYEPLERLSDQRKNRVAVACAMTRDPVVLLIDDALSELGDLGTDDWADLHKAVGRTLVIATRNQSAALRMPGLLAVLLGGRIAQIGPADAIYDDPDNLELAKFLGTPPINLLPGKIDSAGTLSAWGHALDRLRASQAENVTIGVRPEKIEIQPGRSGALCGLIRHIEDADHPLLHIEIDGTEGPATLKAQPTRNVAARVGHPVTLVIHPHALMVFRMDGSRLRLAQLEPAEMA